MCWAKELNTVAYLLIKWALLIWGKELDMVRVARVSPGPMPSGHWYVECDSGLRYPLDRYMEVGIQSQN